MASLPCSRAWVFLLAWIFLAGVSWADTLDLTDDVNLPLVELQQAIEAADADDVNQDYFVACTFHGIRKASGSSRSAFLSKVVLGQPSPPLYQRLSTYRI